MIRSELYNVPAILRWQTVCLFAVLFSVTCTELKGQTAVVKEYNIKAVFIYNFTQFVTWPAAAFTETNSPFIIGILGDDPFKSFIDEVVAGEKVAGRPIKVMRYNDMRDAVNCQILFVSSSIAPAFLKYLPEIRSKSILTVSDDPSFAQTGGMIRFFIQDKKIKLQINVPATRDAGLEVSSKLLRVSETIEPGR